MTDQTPVRPDTSGAPAGARSRSSGCSAGRSAGVQLQHLDPACQRGPGCSGASDRHHDPGHPCRDRRRPRSPRRFCPLPRRDRPVRRRRCALRPCRARARRAVTGVLLGSVDAPAMGVAARRGPGRRIDHLRARVDPRWRQHHQPGHHDRALRRGPVLPEPARHQVPVRTRLGQPPQRPFQTSR